MWLIDRLKEGSTHAGLAAAMQALKLFAPNWAAVLDAATGLFAAIAVAVPEVGAAFAVKPTDTTSK